MDDGPSRAGPARRVALLVSAETPMQAANLAEVVLPLLGIGTAAAPRPTRSP
ncbi:hypothetical protein GCM10009827_106970 [Dactylosporangium maewongense]|uniref:Uncharacterized protein n=1 Tax=Dactylosporangium maewongense TaxID=634393 RepID=A0ABP4NVF8_9ACTN